MRGGWMLTFMAPPRLSGVAPAKVGAHNHRLVDMGPRLRGDDKWRSRAQASQFAVTNRRRAAGGVDGFLGEREVRDLLDARLLVLGDIAVLDRVVDRPLGARRIEAAVDRPHAVL